MTTLQDLAKKGDECNKMTKPFVVSALRGLGGKSQSSDKKEVVIEAIRNILGDRALL